MARNTLRACKITKQRELTKERLLYIEKILPSTRFKDDEGYATPTDSMPDVPRADS